MPEAEVRKKEVLHRPWWRKYLWDQLYKPGEDLNTIQLHGWAVLLGIFGGLVSLLYYYCLKYSIQVLWRIIPDALYAHGVFTHVPSWIYILIMTTLGGVIMGGMLHFMPSPGSVPLMLESLHTKGFLSGKHWWSMLIMSIISMTFGSAVGPEGPVLVIMASISGVLDAHLHQSVRVKRVLSLCSMSGVISAFFGLPLAGALFVLELPHRMGLQYYEALTPAVLSSMVSVFVANSVRREAFDGIFSFPPPPQSIYAYYMLLGVLYGLIGAGIASLITYLYHSLKHFVTFVRLSHRPFILAVIGGLLLGILGSIMPPLLFWSEAELESILHQTHHFEHLGHHFPGLINVDYKSPGYFLGLGCLKTLAIVICLCAGWPGGVVFPLFLVSASFALSLTLWIPKLSAGIAIPCLIAAIETSLLRIPWSTNVIVLLLATVSSRAITVFPVVVVAAQVALFVTRKLRFYPRQVQRSRLDIVSRQDPPLALGGPISVSGVLEPHHRGEIRDDEPVEVINPFTHAGVLEEQPPNEEDDLGVASERERPPDVELQLHTTV